MQFFRLASQMQKDYKEILSFSRRIFMAVPKSSVPDTNDSIDGLGTVDTTNKNPNAVEMERGFLHALEHSALLNVVLDTRGRVQKISEWMLLLTGWREEDVLQKDWFDLFIPEKQREKVRALFMAALAGKAELPRRHENTIQSKSGEVHFIGWNNDEIRDEAGNITATCSIGVDNTPHELDKRMKQAMLEIAEAAKNGIRLSELFKKIDEALTRTEIIPTQNLHIATVSDGKLHLSEPLGYFKDDQDEQPPTAEEMKGGLTDYVLHSGQSLLATPDVFKQMVAEEKVKSLGADSVDWLGVPLIGKDGKPFGVISLQSYHDKVRLSHKHKEMLEFIAQTIASTIERQKIQQESAHRERRLLEAQEIARIGDYELDVSTGCWSSSAELDKIFGISVDYPKTVEGWAGIIHIQHRDEMVRYFLDEVLGNKQNFTKTYMIQRIRDGVIRWVNGRGKLTFDGQGHVTAMIGTIQDVTEQVIAEQEREQAIEESLQGWIKTLDMRDNETKGHSERVMAMTVAFAQAMDYPEDKVRAVRRGALLHDIGKMKLSDNVLKSQKVYRKDGQMSATDRAEWLEMQSHAFQGFKMLEGIKYLRDSVQIPLRHHEHWDGSGYPGHVDLATGKPLPGFANEDGSAVGLKGEEIPEEAQMFAIADIWDAMTTDRPYRPAWPEERVITHLRGLKGTHLNPEKVELFLQARIYSVILPKKNGNGFNEGSRNSGNVHSEVM